MFAVAGKIKLFAFDLDGTVYFGEKLADGVLELLEYLNTLYKVVFFTNNSSKTSAEVHQKLIILGVDCKVEDVYATPTATALYLKDNGIDDVYVVGADAIRHEIKSVGLNVISNEKAKNLVVGLDVNFNYKTIETALAILTNNKDARLVVCNEDASFPIGNNKIKPGSGAMVGAISGASRKTPDYVVGKPNTYILAKIAQTYQIKNDEIVVVGDSYHSDIKMALNYKSNSILIGKLNNINDKSILMVDSIADVLQLVKEN